MRGTIETGHAVLAKCATKPREHNHPADAAIYRCGRPGSATPAGCRRCRL